jgi:putative DNA primase/helicase
MTGITSEKITFICSGKSNGGKTTLLATFLRLIEEYGTLLQIDTLMTREQGNNQQADLADLRGARFVMTSETEENQKLAEARLKRLVQGVDGAKIKATRKYENPIVFPETHKIWIDANHLPKVTGSDSGIWNRLCPIPFLAAIEKLDHDLPAKLQQEAEGILAWAAAGAQEWHTDRLGRPDEIREARAAWRTDSEILKDFFDECCQRKKGSHVRLADLWEEYETWCSTQKAQERSIEKLTRDRFTRRLEDLGFKRVMWRFDQPHPERAWEGIAFL